jgi:hypothetical protein
MKRALLVAFQCPPFSGSSGVQRALKFIKYLPSFGWEPLVLTADPRAYPVRSDDLLAQIPAGTVVKRAFALDASRHLAIGGRYVGFTALPDRWSSWWMGAVPAGLRLVQKWRPSVIWATYPIATTHLIATTLARLTGLPLVADFRDAMVVDDFPEDPALRRLYARIEAGTVRRARAVTSTTPATRELYRARYAGEPRDKFSCIRNGYDEEDFAALPPAPSRPPDAPLRLLHSGLLKRSERDPAPFFGALQDLFASGALARGSVTVTLRAPGDGEAYAALARSFGLQDVVRIEPPVSYAQALAEMQSTDALLLFQDANCNHLVPAKLYEYIRARRPILALTDERGETASVIREAGAGVLVDLASRDAIRAALPAFLRQVEAGTAPCAPLDRARRYSRESQTGELATLFGGLAGEGA